MKPYSKKYLTLALAGVLAASIPATAFAAEGADGTGSETDKKPGVEQPVQPKEKTQEEKDADKLKEA